MNELILELADKAAEDSSSGPWNISDEFCIKFAKMIVRECAGVELYWLNEQDRKAVAEKIKQHFGVEE